MPDGAGISTTREIHIEPSRYKQVELHVAENFVAPDPATLKRIAVDKEIKDRAFAQRRTDAVMEGDFRLPVQSRLLTHSEPAVSLMASWPAYIAAWISAQRLNPGTPRLTREK